MGNITIRFLPRWAQFIPSIILSVLSLTGIGYASSVIAQRNCENIVAKAIVTQYFGHSLVYLDISDEASQDIFKRIGKQYKCYILSVENKKKKLLVIPELTVKPSVDSGGGIASIQRANITWPFLVTVSYTAVYGSLGAEGATDWFLCFFG